ISFKRVETKPDYFGKRGISWHLSYAIERIDSKKVQHSFVHIINNDTKQDYSCILAVFHNLISELKLSGIIKVYIRSDNATCYKSNKIILNISVISQELNVTITEYSFSETQFGKSHADRVCSIMKRSINSTAMRQDIETPRDFYQVLTRGYEKNANNPYSIALIDKLNFKSESLPFKITNIKQYFNFQYDDKKIYASEFRNIIEARIYNISKFAPLSFKNIRIIDSFYVSDFNNYWKISIEQNQPEINKSDFDYDSENDNKSDDELNFEDQFIEENGLKRSNLIEKGIELLVSKTSERAFGASITDIESQPQFKEACIVKKCTHNTNKYKQGWARNKRKTHKMQQRCTNCNKRII
uniref:Integrase catalytic domain-containing protein n=1 Tax=Strongyloides stercoralis TaxID=6248 RepID=A0AAF5DIE0_STRER